MALKEPSIDPNSDILVCLKVLGFVGTSKLVLDGILKTAIELGAKSFVVPVDERGIASEVSHIGGGTATLAEVIELSFGRRDFVRVAEHRSKFFAEQVEIVQPVGLLLRRDIGLKPQECGVAEV